MGDVTVLPGVFRADLETDAAPQSVAANVLAHGVRDLAIVARLLDGSIMVHGTHADCDAAIGLLQRGVLCLLHGGEPVQPLPPEQGEPA